MPPTTTPPETHTERKPPRALRWPLFLAGLLGLSLAAHGVMLAMALSDPNFRVEPDYYRKGLSWDEQKDQARANRKLGWQAAARLRPTTTGSRLTLTLEDADGQPLDDARVVVRVFHNAFANQIVTAELQAQGAGVYASDLPMRRPGLHTIRPEVLRGGARFTCEIKRDLEG